MNRRLFLMSVAGAAGCTPRGERRLNVFNWTYYVAPETIPDFERQYRARVRYVTFESVEEMLAKVATGNSGFDVAFPSNNYIVPLIEGGLLAPLDHRRLKNLDQLEPRFQSPPWDRDLRWSVAYMHGTTGIVYHQSVRPAPSGWGDFRSNLFRGRATMLDDPNEVIGACLKMLGHSLNSVDPGELKQAKEAAIEAKHGLRAYINAEVKDQLVAGDVVAAQLWATVSQLAMDGNPALRFVHPAEGFAVYADSAVILKESRRRELAHEFVDYLLRPEVSARVAATMKTSTANAGALRHLPVELRRQAALYPGPDVLARGEWFEALQPAGQRLRDRIWTEIKTA
jgi:spermidine/putrescine-binding protein